jgi:preprotein translocase subunit SecE
MSNWLNKARTFINDTITELRKCSWPAREELYESTILVIVSVLCLAIFVAVVDAVSSVVIEWLTTI